ncbi:MAG: cysteine--tRNA ligase [Actinomyces urogenitalis]|uniref:Cysteine--tRNA ligase n=1 Tax=Actinomyces urogenitalis TaxID=103621 RepID=A0A2I1KS34_9ACTO|nr:cysteine--tRNA ligase [Actinomyces urogenitalis]MDK8238002.1 cysteine--tRNA ligase [Actinomyces urogenitalis]MDK8835338.1 cysteine--tRNA ligase [Actinomyces urogenitalis]MDU0865277.1 cysteine--tRNA ligase [Actinomyces urogenitalis]MDU0875713.1 cysteine--tRNA ligase [Actinomyces urogenitalis]MDU0973058.1 cysteine--tRNA ligase [Actinomyces urogenitalis]
MTTDTAPALRLYDSAARAVVPLAPTVTPGTVAIYLCGATVQGSPHIGHMRSGIAFDVLRRWLERCGQHVLLVRNVTDIDDKILAKSAAATPPVPWWAWAQRFEREFDAAYRALGVTPPTYEPRATGHVPQMIDLIQRLLDAGHAYVGEAGNVYFDVRSLPDYGSLTNQWVDDLATTEDESQLDEDVEADKRDPRDFALWKKAKPGEPADAAWDTPWGRGRPGWHLECSAMSRRYLGESFDIHGGGIDLRFPHHENEQAQSHGAGWGFARRWVHNAWVTVKGEKMSKSLGNSLVVAELLKSYDPAVLRLALGTVHYRSTVEFSEETLDSAAALWERLAGAVTRAAEVSDDVDAPGEQLRERALPAEYVAAMDDDLNLAGAMAVVHATLKRLNTALAASAVDATEVGEAALDLRAELDVMGLDPLAEPWRSRVLGAGAAGGSDAAMSALDHLVTALIEDRAAARAAKDWARADALRDQLTAAGVVVEDGADGARWHLA